MEHEARQDAQGNGGHPQEEDISGHEEAGIAAGAQHALGKDEVHGLEDHNKADGVHELPGYGLCFRGNLIVVDNRSPHQKDHKRREAAQDKAKPQEGIALLLRLFQIPFAHGVPGHDAAGIGNALGEHGGKLLDNGGHGVGGDKRFPDASHDHGHRVVAQGQQAVADENRDAYAQVFAHKASALHEKVPDPVPDLSVPEEEVPADETQFKQPRDQRAQGGTRDLHARISNPWRRAQRWRRCTIRNDNESSPAEL